MNPYVSGSLGGAATGLLASALIDPTDDKKKKKERTPLQRALRSIAYMLGGAGVGAGAMGLKNRYIGRKRFDVPDITVGDTTYGTDVHVNTPGRITDRQLQGAKAEIDKFKQTRDTDDLSGTKALVNAQLAAGNPSVDYRDDKGSHRKITVSTKGSPLEIKPSANGEYLLPDTNGAKATVTFDNLDRGDRSPVVFRMPNDPRVSSKLKGWTFEAYPGSQLSYQTLNPADIAKEDEARREFESRFKEPTVENILETVDDFAGFGGDDTDITNLFLARSGVADQLSRLSLDDVKKVRDAAEAKWLFGNSADENVAARETYRMANAIALRQFRELGYGENAARFLSGDAEQRDPTIDSLLAARQPGVSLPNNNKDSFHTFGKTIEPVLAEYNKAAFEYRKALAQGNENEIARSRDALELAKAQAAAKISEIGYNADKASLENGLKIPGYSKEDLASPLLQKMFAPQMYSALGLSDEEGVRRGLMSPAREFDENVLVPRKANEFDKLGTLDDLTEFLSGGMVSPSEYSKRRAAEHSREFRDRLGAARAAMRGYDFNPEKKLTAPRRKVLVHGTGEGGFPARYVYEDDPAHGLSDVFYDMDSRDQKAVLALNGLADDTHITNDMDLVLPERLGVSIIPEVPYQNIARDHKIRKFIAEKMFGTADENKYVSDAVARDVGDYNNESIGKFGELIARTPKADLQKALRQLHSDLAHRRDAELAPKEDIELGEELERMLVKELLARKSGDKAEPVAYSPTYEKVHRSIPTWYNNSEIYKLYSRDIDEIIRQREQELESRRAYDEALARLAVLTGQNVSSR